MHLFSLSGKHKNHNGQSFYYSVIGEVILQCANWNQREDNEMCTKTYHLMKLSLAHANWTESIYYAIRLNHKKVSFE